MNTSNNNPVNRQVAGGTEPVSSLPLCGQCHDENKKVPAVHSFLVAGTGEGDDIFVDLCNDCGEEWRTIPQEVRGCKDCTSCFDCHCLERRDVNGRNKSL